MTVIRPALEKLFPPGLFAAQQADVHSRWCEIRDSIDNADLNQLRAANAHWFSQPAGFVFTIPALWHINTLFTARGIAPRWRGFSRFTPQAYAPPTLTPAGTPRSQGEQGRKNSMKRWIDLEWLRSALGTSHATKKPTWAKAFAENQEVAYAQMTLINASWLSGGAKIVTRKSYEVLRDLRVPKTHRLGLSGYIDKDAATLVNNMEKRLKTKIRPRMEALMVRETYPLTINEVERRMQFAEALELAVGSPTDAALIFRWITGESVSRQTMHEMRTKIASQCELTTRHWRPIRT